VTSVDRGDHEVTVTLAGGKRLKAPLLVAADGRNSATREAAQRLAQRVAPVGREVPLRSARSHGRHVPPPTQLAA
jgi:2-polyprenyl-6-methoxyphenol hydroxylase-like FAD-dependent oxidoreductase